MTRITIRSISVSKDRDAFWRILKMVSLFLLSCSHVHPPLPQPLPIETFRFSTFFYSPLLLLHWNPYFGPGTILEAENATYLSTLICAINTYLTSTLHPALRPLLYQHWEFSLKQVQVARNRISGLLPSLRLWFQKRRKVLLYANVHLIL